MRQGSPTLAPDTCTDAELITIAEAARRLSITPGQALALCEDGEIPSGFVGARRLVRPVDVEAYAARLVGSRHVSVHISQAAVLLRQPEHETRKLVGSGALRQVKTDDGRTCIALESILSHIEHERNAPPKPMGSYLREWGEYVASLRDGRVGDLAGVTR